jgi:large subunit ribosomal protein L30
MSTESHLVIRQVKSENGRPWQQRLVLKGLGLRGCGTQVTLLNQRAIRGMIRKVLHLVDVSGVNAGATETRSGGAAEPKAAAKRAPRAAKGSKS